MSDIENLPGYENFEVTFTEQKISSLNLNEVDRLLNSEPLTETEGNEQDLPEHLQVNSLPRTDASQSEKRSL